MMTARISVVAVGGAGSVENPSGVLTTPVLTSRGSGQYGGLCDRSARCCQAGWHSPLLVSDISAGDTTLRVGIRGLAPTSRIGGVWAGTRLLSVSQGGVAGDGYRLIEVAKPGRCTEADDDAAIPTGLRILAIGGVGAARALCGDRTDAGHHGCWLRC